MTSASDPSQVGIRVGYYHNDYMYVGIIGMCQGVETKAFWSRIGYHLEKIAINLGFRETAHLPHP